jgi:hypothetical protein
MKKISRRQLRKMVLNELGSMGDLSSLLGKKDSGYKEIMSIPGESDIPGMLGIRSAIANLPEKVEELCNFLKEKTRNLPKSTEHVDELEGRKLQDMSIAIDELMQRIK